MTGVESKIEGLVQVLNESDAGILEICRSGKLTMRRGHHTSRVLKAMGADPDEPVEPYEKSLEESTAGEPE
jgi:acetolactate synthase-1/3 small subunit